MKRILELDVLRVLALIFVIFQHATWWFVDRYPEFRSSLNFLFLGDLGVSFFIILSGCALTLSGSRNYSVATFYKKRFLSIIPSYWVAYLLVTILLFSINGSFFADFKLKKVLATIFAMDGWLSSAGFQTYYRIGEWFTGFILLVYAVAPFIIFLVKKKPFTTILILTIISYLSVHFNDALVNTLRYWSHFPYCNPTARLAEFSIGVLLGLMILDNKFFNQRICFFLLSGLGSGLLLLMANKYDGLRFVFYTSFFIFLLLALNLIKVLINSSNNVKKILKEFIPSLTFFSSLSFLAFLYHHQIILLLVQRLPLPGNTSQGVNFISYGLLVFATFCLSYILAYFSLPIVNEVKGIAKSFMFRNNKS